MRILAIRGRNLASLEGDFAIDFTAEPLASAGIYAISGPTGSGKSTLLDTMCLALFGRTPRTDQARENEVWLKDVNENTLRQSDPRNLLRRGAVSGQAEVDFIALDGYGYSARWTVRRARDKASGALQDPKITLFRLDTAKEEQGTRKDLQSRITELIGLTFEQFTRSVLLAQNDFATFLKAEQGEKASLLEKLTGTERYSDISRLIYEKYTTAKQAYEQILGRMQGVSLLTEEEKEELETALSQTGLTLQQLEAEKTALTLRLDWFTTLNKLNQDKHQAAIGVESAHKACKASRPREEYLRLVDQVQEARSLFDAVANARRQLAEKQKRYQHITTEITRKQAERDLVQKQYTDGEKAFRQVEEGYKTLLPQLKEARKLDAQLTESLRSLQEAEKPLQEVELQKNKESDRLRGLTEQWTNTNESIVVLEKWKERYISKASIAEQLPLLNNYLNQATTARKKQAKSEALLVTLKETKSKQTKDLIDKQSQWRIQSDKLKETERTLEELTNIQNAVSIEKVQHEIQQLRERKELFGQASLCWKSLFESLQSQQIKQEELIKLQGLLEINEGKQFEMSIKLDIALHLREQGKQTLEQAFMAASQNIVTLRGKLKEGEACPLCGSEHHPYAGEDGRLYQTLVAVEQASIAASNNYDICWKQNEALNQELIMLGEKIVALTNTLQELKLQEKNLQEEWNTMESALRVESQLGNVENLNFGADSSPETLERLTFGVNVQPERADQLPKPSARLEWLTIQTIVCDEKIKELEQTATEYNTRQKDLQLLHQQQLSLRSVVATLDKNITELQGNHTLTQNKIEHEEAFCKEQSQFLQEVFSKTNELFGNEQWQEGWLRDTASFREKLTSFAVEWQNNKEALQKNQELLTRLQAEKESQEVFLRTLETSVTTARELVQKRKDAWQRLTDTRKQLLEGKEADETENSIVETREALKKQLDGLAENLKVQTQILDQQKGTLKQLEADVADASALIYRTQQVLQEWLVCFNTRRAEAVPGTEKPDGKGDAENLVEMGIIAKADKAFDHENIIIDNSDQATVDVIDETRLAELLAKDTQWIAGERNFLQKLENDRITAEATLADRTRKVVEHEAKRSVLELEEVTTEVLLQQQAECQQKEKEIRVKQTEFSFKLRTDEENHQKIASLETEMQTTKQFSEQWASLNEIAGSSDGGKFRRIAQGYTLDVLLSYANIQLRELSNRYRLERVPDTLALQVIDRDMCDEVRTVHSLSGGESFLVSLALALGLSSLSSNKMRVESLFIDEGFGSLDAETLRLAMDALDSLRTQGRKIGVISHVQEMTERIPVQIKVCRGDNGRSYLIVQG